MCVYPGNVADGKRFQEPDRGTQRSTGSFRQRRAPAGRQFVY